MSYTEKILSALNAQFIEALNSPDRLPWQKPWGTLSPRNPLTGKAYKGINRFSLARLPYSQPLFATFKQWAAARHFVRKGEKGHFILIYRPINDDKAATPEKPATDENGNPRPKFFLSGATVFNFEQLDPANPFIPPAIAPTTSPSPADDLTRLQPLSDLLQGYIEREGIKFGEGGERAFYRPSTDSVQMPPRSLFHTPIDYLLTLAHECAHSTGITKRLARYDETNADPFGSKPYAIEELVAEVTASYAFAKHAGEIPNGHTQNAKAYLQSWIAALDKDSRFLVKAFSQAEKALHWLETSSKLTYEADPKTETEAAGEEKGGQ